MARNATFFFIFPAVFLSGRKTDEAGKDPLPVKNADNGSFGETGVNRLKKRYAMGSKSAAPCLHRGHTMSSGRVSPS